MHWSRVSLLTVACLLCLSTASVAQTPSQRVISIDSNQHIVEFYWAASTGYTWTYRDLTAIYPGPHPAANSKLAAFPFPTDDFNANKLSLQYFVGANQHVYELTVTGLYTDLTAATGLASVAAAGTGLTGFFGPIVYYIGSNLHVYELAGGSSWVRTDLTTTTGGGSAAVGAGLTSFVNSNGKHIYYVGTNQHLYELYRNSATHQWSNADLTANHGNVLVATNSSITSFTDNTGQSVFYVATNQHVYQMYWNQNNGWSNGDRTASTGNTLAASGTKLTSFSNAYGQHVFYVSSSQHIDELYWNGTSWANNDLTTATGGTLAAVGAALTSYPLGNDEHVSYSGTDQHVHALYWTPNNPWVHNDMTSLAGAPYYVTGSPLLGFSCGDLTGYPNCI